jgi:hypothetical protein
VDGSDVICSQRSKEFVMKAAIVRSLGSPLEDVNACIDEVLSGEVSARLVFDLRGDVAG